MRDIVLITTYFRPEYLYLCLQALADAEGGTEKEYWVIHDRHSVERNHSREEEENLSVLKHFSDSGLGFQYIEMPCTQTLGNSRCTLESYLRAYKTDARFVYLVEDDILVEKDFFRWHEAVQSTGDYLCSVARLHTMRTDLLKSEDPRDFITSGSDYTSWGSCWKREALAALIPHCCSEYYNNMPAYIRRVFPNSPLNIAWCEQDGLIRRVLMQRRKTTAAPCLKRAYHVGLTGYHRVHGHKFSGTLEQRVSQLSAVLRDGTLPTLRHDFIELEDIDVPRGSTPVWETLRCVQQLS